AGDVRGPSHPCVRSRLDVWRVFDKPLMTAAREAQLIGRNDDPIHPVAAARLELDAEQADRRARHDVGGERIAMAGPGIDPERPRVWRGDEAWMSHQDRGPRLAVRIEAADDEERQLAEQLTMLIGHEVANDFAPDLLQPRAHACAFLQGALAGMKGRVRGRAAGWQCGCGLRHRSTRRLPRVHADGIDRGRGHAAVLSALRGHNDPAVEDGYSLLRREWPRLTIDYSVGRNNPHGPARRHANLRGRRRGAGLRGGRTATRDVAAGSDARERSAGAPARGAPAASHHARAAPDRSGAPAPP